MGTQQAAIRGGVLIAMATLIAGIGGYVITIIAARYLQSEYVYFAAFWAFLYLAVGTFSGFQQEISRGISPLRSTSQFEGVKQTRNSNTWVLATGVATVATVLISFAAAGFGPLVFGDLSGSLFLPLVIGIAANVFVGALTGILYGTSSWWPLTLVIVGDVVFRLLLLVVGFSVGATLGVIAWLVVAPYGLLIFLGWVFLRSKLATQSRLDVGYRQASYNILRTVLASLGTATLVSGMPLFIAGMGDDSNQAHISAVIFSLILTRAPLVVGVLALQSFLVVYFRDHSTRGVQSLRRITAVVTGAGALVSLLSWILGAQVIEALAGESFRLDPLFLGTLALTSLPTALLAISGAFVLSRNQHTAYSAGWVVAALVSTALLFVPLPLESRILLALGAGPLVGLAALTFIAGLKSKPQALIS